MTVTSEAKPAVMRAADAQVDAFVASLRATALAKTSKPLMRSTLYTVDAADGPHPILSWRTQEYAYRQFSQDQDELPTLARGLFTEEFDTPDGKHQRVVVRGYDKFFNVGELAWTQPQAIAAFSRGPYVVSHKENGCIIFVSALTPHELLIASKHAIGSRPNGEQRVSHSEMGRTWLQRHLARSGKTEAELARDLWERNETAVMELCDDAFEEHVLAYTPERTGLHLHGLNANGIEFDTRSMEEVNAFAETYGFLPVRFRTYETLADVEAFAREVGKTGSLDGEPVEGFVVRTTMSDNTDAGKVRPPYKPGQTWFYKIKFDEPYLMYRDWRELTRSMIKEHATWTAQNPLAASMEHASLEDTEAPAEADAEEMDPAVVQAHKDFEAGVISKKELKRVQGRVKRKEQQKSQAKQKADRAAGRVAPTPPTPRSLRKETWLYVQWCFDRLYGNQEKNIAPEPELFAEFNMGHGIIALRERFLAYLATAEGQAALAQVRGHGSDAQDLRLDDRPFEKTLIVPMAVPGCGKTALAVALSRLFGWKHCQSDDVKAKRTGPGFLANVQKALQQSDVVIADRNNHLLKHRDEFVDIVRRVSGPQKDGSKGPRVRIVAMAWRLDGLPHSAIQHVCAARIVDRGDRHQCLRVEDRNAPFQYDTILTRFLKEMQVFRGLTDGEGTVGASDDQFTDAIWMELDESMDDALRRLLSKLCPMLELPMPDDTAIEQALHAGKTYSPATKKALPDMAREDPTKVHPSSYIGVFVHIDVIKYVLQYLSMLPEDVRTSAESLIESMQRNNRVFGRQHVTLVHRSDDDDAAHALWESLYPVSIRNAADRPTYTLHVSALCWNNDVMALEIDSMRSEMLPSVNEDALRQRGRTPHITVGARDASIQAYEARNLFKGGSDVHRAPLDTRDIPGVLGFHSNPK
ncbi:RNA ligase (ATP) [Malassezia obtusa]|uniref:RNA ligase (ATP) n=1 Tax=Malassezia obtusa TaxID=76774 RepID=A0AAF0E4H7_9BASI|nr:RNA ligase (ATP) [Malassezia obtusa]